MSGLSLGLGLSFSRPLLPAGLLDLYPGAAAAYSLRALSRGWVAGDVVEVRRSDFGGGADTADFTEGQIISGALLAFVTEFNASGDGFVSTWYDQSGQANNATQGTTTEQPKLVSAGVLNVNGIEFDGTDDSLDMATMDNPFTGSWLAEVVGYDSGVGARRTMLSYRSTTPLVMEAITNVRIETSGAVTSAPVLTTTMARQLSTAFSDSGTVTCGVNGAIGSALLIGIPSGNADLQIGTNGFGGGINYWNGGLSEVIIYPTDQSANRAAIETNINAAYTIY